MLTVVPFCRIIVQLQVLATASERPKRLPGHHWR
jgi:hypothetical protein